VKLGDGDKCEENGGQASETAGNCASEKAKSLGIDARKGEVNWHVWAVETMETGWKYELTIWRTNFEVMRERLIASRAVKFENQATMMLPTNERGTAPEKTLWSNWEWIGPSDEKPFEDDVVGSHLLEHVWAAAVKQEVV
jgi:hypothetical protein